MLMFMCCQCSTLIDRLGVYVFEYIIRPRRYRITLSTQFIRPVSRLANISYSGVISPALLARSVVLRRRFTELEHAIFASLCFLWLPLSSFPIDYTKQISCTRGSPSAMPSSPSPSTRPSM